MSPKASQAIGASMNRRNAPCHAMPRVTMFSRAFRPRTLQHALGVLMNIEASLGHVAIDGKRLRGSQHETSPNSFAPPCRGVQMRIASPELLSS